MKIFQSVIIFILALLSILAGGAKVFRVPQELEFLQGFGLSVNMIIAFGVMQVAGGVLLLPPKTRALGAALATAAFLISAVLVFLSGNLIFGLISLVPAALAGLFILRSAGMINNR